MDFDIKIPFAMVAYAACIECIRFGLLICVVTMRTSNDVITVFFGYGNKSLALTTGAVNSYLFSSSNHGAKVIFVSIFIFEAFLLHVRSSFSERS
jgi:hypothetical protein